MAIFQAEKERRLKEKNASNTKKFMEERKNNIFKQNKKREKQKKTHESELENISKYIKEVCILSILQGIFFLLSGAFIDMWDVRYGRKGDEVGSQERSLCLNRTASNQEYYDISQPFLPIPSSRLHFLVPKIHLWKFSNTRNQKALKFSIWANFSFPRRNRTFFLAWISSFILIFYVL